MFWGLILKSNKKYTQTLEKPFHLTHAALDYSTCGNEPVQIMYTHDDNSYLLCTLQKEKLLQCSLDLSFNEGDKLCFSTKGNGIVHLTGYLLPEDEFDGFDDEDEDDMEEDQAADLRQMLAGKKDAKKGKKAVQAESDEDESDDEGQLEMDGDDSDDDSEGAEMDDDEDDDAEEEEDSEDEEAAPPKAKQQKIEQNGKKNGAENGQLSKKQQKLEKQKENKETKPAATEGQTKKLQGGLMIQDLKTGSGAEAKTGKKIQVYYEGRLKTNNKVFDATKSGPGFKLTLGRGEVIKAWDLGLAGMKVGGKRRITCPPALAYGAKGNPPVIPQNSTLVFDVELKNVF